MPWVQKEGHSGNIHIHCQYNFSTISDNIIIKYIIKFKVLNNWLCYSWTHDVMWAKWEEEMGGHWNWGWINATIADRRALSIGRRRRIFRQYLKKWHVIFPIKMCLRLKSAKSSTFVWEMETKRKGANIVEWSHTKTMKRNDLLLLASHPPFDIAYLKCLHFDIFEFWSFRIFLIQTNDRNKLVLCTRYGEKSPVSFYNIVKCACICMMVIGRDWSELCSLPLSLSKYISKTYNLNWNVTKYRNFPSLQMARLFEIVLKSLSMLWCS